MHLWYMSICVKGYEPLLACGDQRKTSGMLLYHSLPCLFEAGSLPEPVATLVASKPQWSTCLCSTSWGCRCMQSCPTFIWVPGIGPQILKLVQQCCYPSNHFLSHTIIFSNKIRGLCVSKIGRSSCLSLSRPRIYKHGPPDLVTISFTDSVAICVTYCQISI